MTTPDISKLQLVQDSVEGGSSVSDAASIEKIRRLLKTKNDTSRFVGLALLQSVLDNSPELQSDKGVIVSLWEAISPKFLGRLLSTGSQPSSGHKDSKDMLDLAVAIIHTFTILLPDEARKDARLLGHMPRLAKAILHSSKETTPVIIKTLLTLVSVPGGPKRFAELEFDEWAPLIEIAPEHSYILHMFAYAWQNGTVDLEEEQAKDAMRAKIDKGIQSFVSSFIGTDGTSLLSFIANIIVYVDESFLPQNPQWLGSIIKFIRTLSTNKPIAASRSAYTNCAAALLPLYPRDTARLLFSDEKDSPKPITYLFVNLILIDIRATLPSLLGKLNDPEYPRISERITSALDILTAFISQLIAWTEELEESPESAQLPMSPEHLMKLSESISETILIVIEYLRDRWDASIAGAQGLHPEARAGDAHTSSGSHKTLAWDAKDASADTDAFMLAAIRAIGLWVRDNECDPVRKQCAGLMDMFIELYQSSSLSLSQPHNLDFRLPVIVALSGVLQTPRGVEAFHSHNGWAIISKDILKILEECTKSASVQETDLLRGSYIATFLETIVEDEGSTREDWMDVITVAAGFDYSTKKNIKNTKQLDFRQQALSLIYTILEYTTSGEKKRYAHSIKALDGAMREFSKHRRNYRQLGK
ncbi:hypothetical protein M426DRAFT_72007 [Hypoxylon sp. CI-4A]|nr:hypothetical protein M426DRAFT_72007 [Hypoxylon sp. CI-4A]